MQNWKCEKYEKVKRENEKYLWEYSYNLKHNECYGKCRASFTVKYSAEYHEEKWQHVETKMVEYDQIYLLVTCRSRSRLLWQFGSEPSHTITNNPWVYRPHVARFLNLSVYLDFWKLQHPSKLSNRYRFCEIPFQLVNCSHFVVLPYYSGKVTKVSPNL